MSHYKGATPSNIPLDPRIVPFYEKFYTVSDDPSAHDQYCAMFTSDADFVMGARKAKGAQETRTLREGLWSGPVKTRKHTLNKIFPFGENSRELMLYGDVAYGLKNGKNVTVEWAARAKVVDEGSDLKMSFYQVYLDLTPVTNALKED